MIIIIIMKLGNAVVDIAASSRTWYDWSGLQAGLQSNWKSPLANSAAPTAGMLRVFTVSVKFPADRERSKYQNLMRL